MAGGACDLPSGCSSLPEHRSLTPTAQQQAGTRAAGLGALGPWPLVPGEAPGAGLTPTPRPCRPQVRSARGHSRLLPEPWHPMGRLQPQPCRLVLAGRRFSARRLLSGGVLVAVVMFTSFTDVDTLTPTER